MENACLALSRIAEALASRPEHLEMLCNAGLIANAVQLVAVSEAGQHDQPAERVHLLRPDQAAHHLRGAQPRRRRVAAAGQHVGHHALPAGQVGMHGPPFASMCCHLRRRTLSYPQDNNAACA